MTAPVDPAENSSPATGSEPQQQPEPQPTEPQPKPTETVDFWKQKAREQEARAKANADAARRLQEIEDRDKSELQRAQEAAARAATELASLQRQNAFLSKGIPVDLIPPSSGSPEDMVAFADRLLAWKGQQAPVAPKPPQPQPDPAQGAHPIPPSTAEEAEFGQHWAALAPNSPTRK